MQLYFKYIKLVLKSQLQYRTSFILTLLAQFLAPFAALAGIAILMNRFNNLYGWSKFEVFLCFSIIGASFSISTCIARGFDSFPGMIRNAGFDRILVRPRNTVLQILGSAFDIKRAGHLIQAFIILFIAVINIKICWDITGIITLINMIIGGTGIFCGIYLLQATLAFWTVDGLEIANIFTHGIKEYASYPLSVLPKWLTRFFTFIVPVTCVNYLPLYSILGKSEVNRELYMLLPLIGVLFIIPCILAWRFGVKHYRSTGS